MPLGFDVCAHVETRSSKALAGSVPVTSAAHGSNDGHRPTRESYRLNHPIRRATRDARLKLQRRPCSVSGEALARRERIRCIA